MKIELNPDAANARSLCNISTYNFDDQPTQLDGSSGGQAQEEGLALTAAAA